jgi:BNR repeat-like domain
LSPIIPRKHHVEYILALLTVLMLAPIALAAGNSFSPPVRLGFTVGDQWEPAIAADGFGHVYVLYPQYGVLPSCPDKEQLAIRGGSNGAFLIRAAFIQSCSMPSMTLVVSDDNGSTWQAPHAIALHATGQFDAQIVVDPDDHRTVYAAWLQDDNIDAMVAKSVDFGQSWSIVVADRGSQDADKPSLAVRGRDVYLALNRSRRIRVASSHDGGITFGSVEVNPASPLVRALAGGATVDPDQNAYIAWAGYTRRNGAKGRVNLYTSKSSDGGRTWTTTLMDSSGAPPDCSQFQCEWGYLGAQITMASDEAGTLYALWNSGKGDTAPERIYFALSTTAGETWSPKTGISLAPVGVEHAFPALVAGSTGDVRAAWMDTRVSPLWNVYYRSSTNGGATWSAESRLSAYVPGYRYIRSKGFSFPFGDYFQINIDNEGYTQAVWGEGLNFRSPGSIWYSNGR